MARNLFDSGLIKSTTVTAEGENTVKVATTSSSSSTDPMLQSQNQPCQRRYNLKLDSVVEEAKA